MGLNKPGNLFVCIFKFATAKNTSGYRYPREKVSNNCFDSAHLTLFLLNVNYIKLLFDVLLISIQRKKYHCFLGVEGGRKELGCNSCCRLCQIWSPSVRSYVEYDITIYSELPEHFRVYWWYFTVSMPPIFFLGLGFYLHHRQIKAFKKEMGSFLLSFLYICELPTSVERWVGFLESAEHECLE